VYVIFKKNIFLIKNKLSKPINESFSSKVVDIVDNHASNEIIKKIKNKREK
jgi:hypothetical protein